MEVKITDEKRRTNEHGKKRKRKRRRSPFFAVFIFILLIGCGITVSIMIFFKVENIEIHGKTDYSDQEISDACGIRQGQNLLAINQKKASSALCEKLPYIKTASVQLQPLSTVIITLTKDVPCGAVQNGSSYILLDDSLKILETGKQASAAKGLPVIKGLVVQNGTSGKKIVADRQNTTGIIVDLYNSFRDNKIDIGKITSIDVSDSYEISIRYENRINILIGTSSYISYKVKSANYIIRNNLGPKEKGKLDVSETVPDSSDKQKIYFDAEI